MKKFLAFILSAFALTFVACGDDVTKVYENSGIATLEPGKKLSKQDCDSTNVGEFLFVKDSSATFMCDGKSWVNMKGEDGKDGKGSKGAPGDEGSSCTVKKVTKKKSTGYVLACGKDVVDTLWNGKNGDNGDNGDDGVGCKVASDKDGVVTLVCGEGKDADTTKLYKAVCDNNPYDPTEKFCYEGLLVDYCDGKTYNPTREFCDNRDNQIYKMVKIDYQVWMAENLNINSNFKDKKGNEIVNNICAGGNYNEGFVGDCEKYGRAYLWSAAMDSAGIYVKDGNGKGCGDGTECNIEEPVRGICPEGWHLPSNKEWQTLFDAVGGENIAARKLKSSDGWENGKNGTDDYGFNVLPVGQSMNFPNLGLLGVALGAEALFWSTSLAADDICSETDDCESLRNSTVFHSDFNVAEKAFLEPGPRNFLLSVRCVQDAAN